MPIVDSVKNRIISSLNKDEIMQKAEEIRFYTGLSSSISGNESFSEHNALINIAAVLYFNYISHDPMNPFWDKRDRVFWSDAEFASVAYSALGLSGYFPLEDFIRRRKIPYFDILPDRFVIPGIEFSVSTPGIGLGVAVGDALSALITKNEYEVFCIMSRSEHLRGTVWEAAAAAFSYRLDNLVVIIENSIQDSSDCLLPDFLESRYISFGWQVFHADSSDPENVIDILKAGRRKNKLPSALILDNCINNPDVRDTVSSDFLNGKTITENILVLDEADKADEGLIKNHSDFSVLYSRYGWNSGDKMKAEFLPVEKSLTDYIRMIKKKKSSKTVFFGKIPPLADDEINSEENVILTASGLAKEGLIPFIIFRGGNSPEKKYDQLRNTVCLNNFNVKFVDLYRNPEKIESGRFSCFSDDISIVKYLQNMISLFPSDLIEAEKLIKEAADKFGPVFIRLPIGQLPLVTGNDSPCTAGCANVIRYRGVRENFRDAFEICRGSDYADEKEDLSIVTYSRIVPEAMRSAYILKEEFCIEARIVNIVSITPFDEQTVRNAFSDTEAVLIAGERTDGSFNDIVASCLMKIRTGRSAAVLNCSADSSLSAEFISEKAVALYHMKNNTNEK